MGSLLSSRNVGVEELDIAANSVYKYPPKSGSYFGSHFMMGGQRFETTQPEAYLFGENNDLNFLGNRPVPFPYAQQRVPSEPTRTLKSLVNIRKDSLKLIRETSDDAQKCQTKYTLEFVFDSEVKIKISIYLLSVEEITNGKAVYHPKESSLNSSIYKYGKGTGQVFSQPQFVIDIANFSEDQLIYDVEKEVIPIVIQCCVDEGNDLTGHAHMLFAIFEKLSDESYAIKPLKQKQMVDGVCFLLQEIYGIENKLALDGSKDLDDDSPINCGEECVICMSEARDTLILPCRHLCLCSTCAEPLRHQASSCPICRAPFRALLQIHALHKKAITDLPEIGHNRANESLPLGYEAIPLGEALNGTESSILPMSTLPRNTLPPLRTIERPTMDLLNEEGLQKYNKKLNPSAHSHSLKDITQYTDVKRSKKEIENSLISQNSDEITHGISLDTLLNITTKEPEKPRKFSLPTPDENVIIKSKEFIQRPSDALILDDCTTIKPNMNKVDEESSTVGNMAKIIFQTGGLGNQDLNNLTYADEDEDELPYVEDEYSRDGCDTDSMSTYPGVGIISEETSKNDPSSCTIEVDIPGTPIASISSDQESVRESSGSYASNSSVKMLIPTIGKKEEKW